MKSGEKSGGRQPNYAHRIKAKMLGEVQERIQSAAAMRGAPMLLREAEASFNEMEGSLVRGQRREKTSPNPKAELLSPGRLSTVKHSISKTLQNFFSGLAASNHRTTERTFNEFSAMQASKIDETISSGLGSQTMIGRTSSIRRDSRKSDGRLRAEVKDGLRSPLGSTNRTSLGQSPGNLSLTKAIALSMSKERRTAVKSPTTITVPELLHISPSTPEDKAWVPPPGFKGRELSSDSMGRSRRVSSTSKMEKRLKKVLSPPRAEQSSLRALDTTNRLQDWNNRSEGLFGFGSVQPKRKSLSRSKAPKEKAAPVSLKKKLASRFEKEATIDLVGEEPRRKVLKSESQVALNGSRVEKTRMKSLPKFRAGNGLESQEPTPETRSIDFMAPESVPFNWNAQLAGRQSLGKPAKAEREDAPTLRLALERLSARTQRILSQYRQREEAWTQERSAYEGQIKSLMARISHLEDK